ncbi:MAG: hypothetical protein IJ158_14020 [Treponema sp.]|nr:hypothetical protein [Treponema sp.]
MEARNELTTLDKHLIDVLEISRPPSIEYAKQLAKVISKLSPLLGNMIEFSTVDLLNKADWNGEGKWIRQDPGFPDALFKSDTVVPNPGIEIKAWFPLATEITARFRDSVTIFEKDNIDMALIAWLPENVIWGKPQIIDTLVVSGKSVAKARDTHYHRPPDYLVFEPEDTSNRTANLQQTNTNGYKLQTDKCSLAEAKEVVNSWGEDQKEYSPLPKYQSLLRTLYGQFVYRLDTNYAKIDRIEHKEIEAFKQKVLSSKFKGKTIKSWADILSSGNETLLEEALSTII